MNNLIGFIVVVAIQELGLIINEKYLPIILIREKKTTGKTIKIERNNKEAFKKIYIRNSLLAKHFQICNLLYFLDY